MEYIWWETFKHEENYNFHQTIILANAGNANTGLYLLKPIDHTWHIIVAYHKYSPGLQYNLLATTHHNTGDIALETGCPPREQQPGRHILPLLNNDIINRNHN